MFLSLTKYSRKFFFAFVSLILVVSIGYAGVNGDKSFRDFRNNSEQSDFYKTCLHSGKSAADFSQTPVGIPVEPNPAEETDEKKENKKSEEENLFRIQQEFFTAAQLYTSSCVLSYFRITQQFFNRKRPCLLALFHSWKSYLI